MKPDATIEAQIEAAWLRLLDRSGLHAFWLTPGGRLREGVREAGGIDIGHFDRRVSLADFRAAVFEGYAELKAAVHGVGHG